MTGYSSLYTLIKIFLPQGIILRSYVITLVFMCAILGMLVTTAHAQSAESMTYMDTAGRYADLQHEVERRVSGGENANSTLLGYLCIAYGKLKQYEKLFDCTSKLDESIQRGDITMDLDQHVMFISSSDIRPLPNTLRARAYLELGDYQKAISFGNSVLATLARIPKTGGTSLYPTMRYQMLALEVLGLSAVRINDLSLAKQYAKQLEDVSPPFIGGRMWGWIKNNSLAQIYMAIGNYDEALKYIPDTSSGMQIVVSFVNGLGPYAYRGDSTTTILELPRRAMRGIALAKTGKISEAKSTFDQILATPRIKDVGDIYWLVLLERGQIAETENQPEQAAALYREAIGVVERQRSTINTEASKIGFVGDKQNLYKRIVAVLIAQGKIADAFGYIERSKSRALVDMLASKKDFAVPGGDPAKMYDLLTKVEQAEINEQAQGVGTAPSASNSQIDQAPQSTPLAGVPSSSSASGQRNLAVSTLKQAIAETSPEVASLISVSSTPIEKIQARIPEDEVLVEYYYDDKSLFIFLLSRQGLQMLRTDVGNLIAQARALHSAVANMRSDAYIPIVQNLYQQLIKPMEHLLGGRSKLIIVPQGALHYVPFAALHDGSQFLLDKYAFRMLPSASVVEYLHDKQAHKPGGILAFGNPDLGDPKYDLKFAEEEAKAIIQTIPKSRAVLRQNATEMALRENVADFNYLHFATHGEFNADAPLNSALALARDTVSDGLLTVSKLYSMRLDVDLATLSACETGLGKIANGDDVVGLTRGFLYAGVSSIVASLWQVDDQATSALMIRFYEGLKNKDKREALREAQIATRKEYPHPYYWAAFQLTGNAI